MKRLEILSREDGQVEGYLFLGPHATCFSAEWVPAGGVDSDLSNVAKSFVGEIREIT